jgi:peptidoglycan-associated lipoprotein
VGVHHGVQWFKGHIPDKLIWEFILVYPSTPLCSIQLQEKRINLMTHLYRIIRRYAVVSFIVALSSGCASRSRDTSEITRPYQPEAHADANSTNSGLKLQDESKIVETEISDTALPSDADAKLNKTSIAPQAGEFEIIYFGLDDSMLSALDRDKLNRNFSRMRSKKGAEFTLEGHCDERGDSAYNMALGERRAQTVKKFLVALGLPEAKLQVVSFGKETPADLGHNEVSWAKNRRVEIKQR